MDESTVRDCEALFLAYVRNVDKNEFAKNMLFCKSLGTITIATMAVNPAEGGPGANIYYGAPIFFVLNVQYRATFLNTGIIDDSALEKDFSIQLMSHKSIELNR